MNCLECGASMSVRRTMRTGTDRNQVTAREHVCACGQRYVSEQRITRRLNAISSIPVSQGQHTGAIDNAVRTAENRPKTAVPCDSSILRGEGGCSDPTLSDLIPSGSISDLRLDHSQGFDPARAKTYPTDFEILWEQTGKRGTKGKAFRAWKTHGRPSWVAIQSRWRAYLLSERPVSGYVQDLSTWLNGDGHMQDWEPARERHLTGNPKTAGNLDVLRNWKPAGKENVG